MESGDERFENYLREFEPRRPRALTRVETRFEWRRLAAAAVVVIVVGGSTWFAVHRRWPLYNGSTPTRTVSVRVEFAEERLSILSLTQTALQNPAWLDTELTEESRRVLPDFRGKESILRVLAKE